MRYLSWDEVCELEKFLAEDNDDAVGMEIQTGHYTLKETVCYGEPETVQTYTLEALSGGEFVPLGQKTLRAVVGNRLYYTYNGRWVDNTGTDAVDISGNAYTRAVLTFREPILRLPEEEILSLDRFLCRDNKRVRGIRIMPGYKGLGGSNTSGFSSDSDRLRDYPLEYLADCGFLWVEGVALRALVNDVLYFTSKDKVYTLNYRERDRLFYGRSVAYDTIEATEVVLLLK